MLEVTNVRWKNFEQVGKKKLNKHGSFKQYVH